MHALDEIESMLRSSEELRQKIVRNLGSSTVALFADVKRNGETRHQLVGSGSLVLVGSSHYILTAAHVWQVIQSAPKLGYILTDNIRHKPQIDVGAIVATTFTPEAEEWGPDLALLRIPPVFVGGIQAYKVFDDLKAPKSPNVESLTSWVIMGTPDELAPVSIDHTAVQISGRFVQPCLHNHGRYDYFDFEIESGSSDLPLSWGGVSGGGLWKVLVYRSRDTGKIDWVQCFKGVAFWQSSRKNGYRLLRCHGPKTITRIVRTILP